MLITGDVEEPMVSGDHNLMLDRGHAAPRGRRGTVVRALSASLLGKFGFYAESDGSVDPIGRQP